MYESLSIDDATAPMQTPRNILVNFVILSVCFSVNHGAVTSCLALAVPLLGNAGAIQSGILYLTYTASSILGATYVSKKLGARDALILGMFLYCAYVGCFLFATMSQKIETTAAVIGALIGGIGGGFIWTAQGSYFGTSSDLYASLSEIPVTDATALLGGIFAFIYLALEVFLKIFSTAMINAGYQWRSVFMSYFVVAILATFWMFYAQQFENNRKGDESNTSIFYKVTAAGRLLVEDPKTKYMFGLNAAFGFSASFLASFVGGTFEMIALSDEKSKFIGILSSATPCVAAIFSLFFGFLAQKPRIGKGPILILGATFFFLVGFSFVLVPDPTDWGWPSLLMIYGFQGIGRATYEGTLRATFADMFPSEKEGAFANIILQNGLSSSIGYFVSPIISPLAYKWVVMLTSIFGIAGYLRAASIQNNEYEQMPLIENDSEANPPGTVV